MNDNIDIGNGGCLSFPSPISPGVRLHIVNTISNAMITGQPSWSDIVVLPAGPPELKDREKPRRKQRCPYCGSVSWMDDTITCLGCQGQVFEDI